MFQVAVIQSHFSFKAGTSYTSYIQIVMTPNTNSWCEDFPSWKCLFSLLRYFMFFTTPCNTTDDDDYEDDRQNKEKGNTHVANNDNNIRNNSDDNNSRIYVIYTHSTKSFTFLSKTASPPSG